MFGLFKKKTVNFGRLIKEQEKVVLLLGKDFFTSLKILSQLNSWHQDFHTIIVKTDDYFLRFWQSLLQLKNLTIVSQLSSEQRCDAIVLDFKEPSSEISKFKKSLILSSDKTLCNFSFSAWEKPLLSFAKLFSLNLVSDNLFINIKKTNTSKDITLIDTEFNRKIKKLQETHKIVASKQDPSLEKKDFLEIFELGLKANKIFCFDEKRKNFWEALGLKAILIKQGQDYAQLL